ncbi:LytR/AlgR family response regulator transcription factor [Myroides sp. LJL119]
MKISCIAIDDEPLALQMIERKVAQVDFLELKGTFNSAAKALKYLSESFVDCIFLDIHMPDFNGVELAKLIEQFAEKPKIVFVTAYASFLQEELQDPSVFYLLKPYGLQDFKIIANKLADIHLTKITKEQDLQDSFLFVKINSKQIKVYFSEILFLQSMGDYVKIFTQRQDAPLVTLITLKKIKSYLPKHTFLQINRSEIIHLHKIDSYEKTSVYIGDKNLRITNTYKEAYMKIKSSLI